ncbi:MAG: UpxY family transcription antiterminator [Bacteroidota bacterium]|nr:UpxY family transcription antiterminator [Rhodothermia bacterium]MDW8285660.1 UpxY family transcription antiterminator [Bacteroidota bacterium]
MEEVLSGSGSSLRWYAIYTRANAEKCVFARLVERRIEAYLPLLRQRRQWKDRKKWVDVPVFRNYVFVRITLRECLAVLQVEGVVQFVRFGGEPTPIPDHEIEAVRRILTYEPERVEVLGETLVPGDPVRVVAGPLRGIVGRYVMRKGGGRLVVYIEHLCQGLAIEVPAAQVERLPMDAPLRTAGGVR